LFTGLIFELGDIVSLERRGKSARLFLDAKSLSQEAKLGDSIAINGTCLTIVEIRGTTLAFDISDETLKSTNLGELKVRDRVNLEPALRLSDRLGGHFVTGHIDGVGRMRSKSLEGEVYRIVIETEPWIAEYLVEKGSVAVDGISLTVVDLLRDGFSLVIIPHTAKLTTLGLKSAGDRVNVEVDILGKYVSKYLKKGKDSNLMQTLKASGFA
jgi:riboflavin synthase